MLQWFPTDIDRLLVDTAIVFTAGLLCAVLVRFFRQSALVGYLLAGLLIGPYGFGLVANLENISFLADVGVVFIMFALGVQLSLRQLLEVRVTAIIGGLAQVLLMIALGIGAGWVLGLPPWAGLVVGYAIALSSSVVVIKLLSDYDELQTPYGRIAIGISLIQDLMAVVLISTLPFLGEAARTSYPSLLLNLVKAVLFVLWVMALARWVAPYILARASATGSREIFLPTVVVLSLIGAMLSAVFGFSFALGAFLAGLVISESLFSQAVLAEMIPLRDLFGLLFFVSLGMLVNPAGVVLQAGAFSLLLVIAVFGKALIIFLLILLLRHHPYTAVLAAMSMAQVGEFSFVITREAERIGVISTEINRLILSVAIVSIALTPILVPLTRFLYARLFRKGQPAPEAESTYLGQAESATVLLCGYGRVGRTITQALDTFRVPFMVIDIDRRAVEALRRRGIRAVYGDAANPRLLQRIELEHFHLCVITVAEQSAVQAIAVHLRKLHPAMRLLVRSHSDRETASLLTLGVEGVVHIELEASLAFVREVLTTADVDNEIVEAYLDDIRLGYYEALQPPERQE
jgi:CPA2 family monovalent cation:H+ antiporter-2